MSPISYQHTCSRFSYLTRSFCHLVASGNLVFITCKTVSPKCRGSTYVQSSCLYTRFASIRILVAAAIVRMFSQRISFNAASWIISCSIASRRACRDFTEFIPPLRLNARCSAFEYSLNFKNGPPLLRTKGTGSAPAGSFFRLIAA